MAVLMILVVSMSEAKAQKENVFAAVCDFWRIDWRLPMESILRKGEGDVSLPQNKSFGEKSFAGECTLREKDQRFTYFWSLAGFYAFFILFTIYDFGNTRPEVLEGLIHNEDIFSNAAWTVVSRPILTVSLLGVFFVPARNLRAFRVIPAFSLMVGIALAFSCLAVFEFDSIWPVLLISQLLCGIGFMGCCLTWITYLAKQSMAHAVKLLLIAFFAATIVRVFVASSVDPMIFWIVVFGTLGITVASFAALPYDEDEKTGSGANTHKWTAIKEFGFAFAKDYTQPLLCAAIITFTSVLFAPLYPGAEFDEFDAALFRSVGLFLGAIALWMLWKKRGVLFVSDSTLLNVALLEAVAVMLLPILGERYLPFFSMMGSALYAAVLLVMYSIFIEVSKENEPYTFVCMCISFMLMGFALNASSFMGASIRLQVDGIARLLFLSLAVTTLILFLILLFVRINRSTGEMPQKEFSAVQPATILVSFTEEDLRNSILSDRYGLSAREMEVLYFLLGSGNTSSVAKALFISENTVKTHKKRIYQKLNVHNKQQLIDLVTEICEKDSRECLSVLTA